jgi:hypothetical protein
MGIASHQLVELGLVRLAIEFDYFHVVLFGLSCLRIVISVTIM